jgi:hypothetical protein
LAAALVTATAGCSTTALGAAGPAAKSGAPVTSATATATVSASGSAAGAAGNSAGNAGGSGSNGGSGSGTTGAGSSSGSGGAPECTASVLSIDAVTGPSGDGHQSELLHFSNIGSHACFVRGYPGVAQLRGSQTLQNAVRTRSGYLGGLPSGQSIPTVVLDPGHSASALVEALDAAPNGSNACAGAGATGLLVTAPDQTSTTQLPSLLTACADFQVHPIIGASSGSGGSDGSQNSAGLEVDITPEGGIALTPGGPAVAFTVLLHNPTTTDYAQVGLVVSFGHCSCTMNTLFPSGTLTVVDPRFSGSQPAPYDVEGFGTDFLTETAVPAIAILAGQTDIFTFHVRLSSAQSAQVGHGASNVDVTLTDAANNQPVGPSPLASLPISIS